MKIDVSKNDFWVRFDKIRIEKGLTIRQICKMRPELKYDTIAKQRNRNTIPNATSILNIAIALDVPYDILLPKENIVNIITEEDRVRRISDALQTATDKQLSAIELILNIPDTERKKTTEVARVIVYDAIDE
jgi:transcriptional regulator with XRE-family HTH domain